MALKYKIKTEDVYDGEDLIASVHGLSLNAIVGLVNLNRPAVEMLFKQFDGKDANTISDEQISGIGMEMIDKAPLFVAQIIALATDAYDDADEGRNPIDFILNDMTVGAQLALLERIGPLTFSAGGGAKKLLALVLKAVQGGSQSAK